MSKNENKPQIEIAARGSVLPPGMLPKIGLGGVEALEVEILHVSDQDGMNIAKVKYPDDFERNHQADSVDDLIGKVSNQLKGRYGVETFEFEAIPQALKAGEKIKVKGVTYGA